MTRKNDCLQKRRARKGAIMLEYALIAAIVAVACIASFKAYGISVRDVIRHVIPNSRGALEKP